MSCWMTPIIDIQLHGTFMVWNVNFNPNKLFFLNEKKNMGLKCLLYLYICPFPSTCHTSTPTGNCSHTQIHGLELPVSKAKAFIWRICCKSHQHQSRALPITDHHPSLTKVAFQAVFMTPATSPWWLLKVMGIDKGTPSFISQNI